MRIGVFIDISNLYHGSRKNYSRKLDYGKYLDFVGHLGDVTIARAYGSCVGDGAKNFIGALRKQGYKAIFTRTKLYHDGPKDTSKGDMDSVMIVDIMRMMDQFDKIVLGSGDADFKPVLKECLAQGKDVIILACNVASCYNDMCQVLEVHEGLLEAESE